ncbi:hypothetical protein V2J09_023484 [Rumex salicifolius]
MGKKHKKTKAPELPPDVPDEDIEFSDEDVEFVSKHIGYAKFVSRLDTRSIDRHVTRIADEQDDKLEAAYEKRLRKRSLENDEEKKGIEIDPVDALPVKTLDGEVYYRTAPKSSSKLKNDSIENTGVEGDDNDGKKSGVFVSKPEKRAKMKKSRKEAKKQENELVESQEPDSTPQAEVLVEVKEELTAEEASEDKKRRIAELGTALLSDPENNIKSLKTMLQFCKDEDKSIAKLGLLSCLAVFRDIIPGYRIRLPTAKELEMNVSKAIKKMRYFEGTLLSAYKEYLQGLFALERNPLFRQVAVRCLCTLLETVPHFNFRENLLPAVVKNIGSLDDATRNMCCSTIKSLFSDESKHGGEATVEAVRLISEEVKLHDCQLHPDSVEVFLSLSFDEDLGKSRETEDDKAKYQKNKKRRKGDDQKQSLIDDRKRSKKEQLLKTREEVNADFKAASFTQDVEERKRIQSKTLSALFNTYFRVLKHAAEPATASSQGIHNLPGRALRPHPLLGSCLKGVGKFSHFIDLDFMADLMKVLKILASGNAGSDGSEGHLTVSERLRCCIVAFKVMKNNLDALKIDLQDFFVQLYNLILEHRPERDHGDVLAEALKVMLCDDRQQDMQRSAAFIKRLATSSMFFGSAESMAALVTVKQLLQKNVKCRHMLENDPGGGSVSGSIVKYQPYSSDPHMSGALASVLWELNLLLSHFHPAVSTMASSILSMSTAPNQAFMSTLSPMQAYANFSLEKESFNGNIDMKKIGSKRKRGASLPDTDETSIDAAKLPNEERLKKKLTDNFNLLRDIEENEKLRLELNRTLSSLNLYEEYKKQKKTVQQLKQRK